MRQKLQKSEKVILFCNLIFAVCDLSHNCPCTSSPSKLLRIQHSASSSLYTCKS